MKTLLLSMWLGLSCLAALPEPGCGAVGCSLNNPDRDIRKIFPDATGYRTEYITIKERGGDSLAAVVETRLGDELDEVYETIDVPYAYYHVLKGKEVIGRVHGVNQKGKYGAMQLILATDPDGVIVSLYYQKISSPEAKRFKSISFTDRFEGLTLADFYGQEDLSEEERRVTRLGRITDPSEKSTDDFRATLRGVMKNLILLDEFQLGNRHLRLIEDERARADRKEGTDETADK